jgi:nicotinate phosphoribosyltransferase
MPDRAPAVMPQAATPPSCEVVLAAGAADRSDLAAARREAPEPTAVAAQTDSYFLKTKAIVEHFGDRQATYAVFMRRPVICAARFAIEFLESMGAHRSQLFDIELSHPEGAWVGAGEPILHVSGSLFHLVDLETVLLQKLGPACVAAYNAYAMCADLPKVAFLAMDARHCAGAEMAAMMAYAAAVGSAVAQREAGAVGFVGCAADATARFFGQARGLGTMPHALIGYAGSTVRAAEMFREVFADEPMTVLIDYFGHELTDALAVARRFPELAAAGRLAFRLDTPGSRYCEGLDPARSYEVLERHAPHSIRGYRTEEELRYLVGTGVSAAAIWLLRHVLDEAGFTAVKIVASSGFGPAKCRIMAAANAPVDVIGSGSYLPELWSETYATADIIAYDGMPMVKAGREFLLRQRKEQ